jgi:tRNA-dihydrouridine synthase A
MLDWTDRHCRYLFRLLTRHARLYTEMVTTGAILYGPRERYLQHDAAEHPVALQLGGSEPAALAACAVIGADHGYDEINLNVGCPSDRVQSGRFGACLMAEPQLVAECVAAMTGAVAVPVTVKTRTGIDDQDSYAALAVFVQTVAAAGCRRFIIHARKAWLHGLSPKENRTVPPLEYAMVWQLKRDFPELEIIVNGGIDSLDAAAGQLRKVDGVMLGRAAYHNPYLLTQVDSRFFADPHPVPAREQVVDAMLPYIERELAAGTPLRHMTRHMTGLFQGVPGARTWRGELGRLAADRTAGTGVVATALARATAAGLQQRQASYGYGQRHG